MRRVALGMRVLWEVVEIEGVEQQAGMGEWEGEGGREVEVDYDGCRCLLVGCLLVAVYYGLLHVKYGLWTLEIFNRLGARSQDSNCVSHNFP